MFTFKVKISLLVTAAAASTAVILSWHLATPSNNVGNLAFIPSASPSIAPPFIPNAADQVALADVSHKHVLISVPGMDTTSTVARVGSGYPSRATLNIIPNTREAVNPVNIASRRRIDISNVKFDNTPPPLEMQRAASVTRDNLEIQNNIQIQTGFECGTPLLVERKSSTHLVLTLNDDAKFRDWFMFRIIGGVGKVIRIDIRGDDALIKNWRSLNPVYTYATDLDDLATYSDTVTAISKEPISKAWNGPTLPSTQGEKWHFIENCWMENAKTVSMVQKIGASETYIAMRVPHPPGYNAQFLKTLTKNSNATVTNVGTSHEGRQLQIIKISSDGHDREGKKPCIVVYAGEHPDEQDSVWVAQGVAEYLTGTSAEAEELREQFTFLVLPMIDPDAAAAGEHAGIICSFQTDRRTVEAIAYANWFRSWVDNGNRIDLVLNFHNVQSNEGPQVSYALMEGVGVRGKLSSSIHNQIVNDLLEAGYTASPRPGIRGWSPDRLGGWLTHAYGALTLAYEVNAQASDRHLNITQLKQIGMVFATSIAKVFSSGTGSTLLSTIDASRKSRTDRWTKYGQGLRADYDSIQLESIVLSRQELVDGNNSEMLREMPTP